MGYQYLSVQTEQRTGIITVDFPPANSLAPEVRDELKFAVTDLADHDDVWVLILTGAGEKFFMAGANIPSLLELEPDTALTRVQAARQLFDLINNCPKPIIAAINGLCLGGGLELALACDLRLASDHVKLGLPEVNLGLMPGGGGTQRLSRLIGPGLARYLIFTGQTLTAARALEVGIIEQVSPSEELIPAAKEMAALINSKGPLGVRAAKKSINAGLEMTLSQGLDLENRLWSELCGTRDMKEGVNAFLEKRTPQFEGH